MDATRRLAVREHELLEAQQRAREGEQAGQGGWRAAGARVCQ